MSEMDDLQAYKLYKKYKKKYLELQRGGTDAPKHGCEFVGDGDEGVKGAALNKTQCNTLGKAGCTYIGSNEKGACKQKDDIPGITQKSIETLNAPYSPSATKQSRINVLSNLISKLQESDPPIIPLLPRQYPPRPGDPPSSLYWSNSQGNNNNGPEVIEDLKRTSTNPELRDGVVSTGDDVEDVREALRLYLDPSRRNTPTAMITRDQGPQQLQPQQQQQQQQPQFQLQPQPQPQLQPQHQPQLQPQPQPHVHGPGMSPSPTTEEDIEAMYTKKKAELDIQLVDWSRVYRQVQHSVLNAQQDLDLKIFEFRKVQDEMSQDS